MSYQHKKNSSSNEAATASPYPTFICVGVAATILGVFCLAVGFSALNTANARPDQIMAYKKAVLNWNDVYKSEMLGLDGKFSLKVADGGALFEKKTVKGLSNIFVQQDGEETVPSWEEVRYEYSGDTTGAASSVALTMDGDNKIVWNMKLHHNCDTSTLSASCASEPLLAKVPIMERKVFTKAGLESFTGSTCRDSGVTCEASTASDAESSAGNISGRSSNKASGRTCPPLCSELCAANEGSWTAIEGSGTCAFVQEFKKHCYKINNADQATPTLSVCSDNSADTPWTWTYSPEARFDVSTTDVSVPKITLRHEKDPVFGVDAVSTTANCALKHSNSVEVVTEDRNVDCFGDIPELPKSAAEIFVFVGGIVLVIGLAFSSVMTYLWKKDFAEFRAKKGFKKEGKQSKKMSIVP